jgi:hypothetical protein
MMHEVRSVKSTKLVSFSAPITSTRRARPAAMKASPVCSAVRKPVQAALTSKAPALVAPSRSWTRQAVEGSR